MDVYIYINALYFINFINFIKYFFSYIKNTCVNHFILFYYYYLFIYKKNLLYIFNYYLNIYINSNS